MHDCKTIVPAHGSASVLCVVDVYAEVAEVDEDSSHDEEEEHDDHDVHNDDDDDVCAQEVEVKQVRFTDILISGLIIASNITFISFIDSFYSL